MPKKQELKVQFRDLSPRNKFEVANPELTPEQINKMEKIMELLDLHGIDYSKFKPEHLSFIQNKKAYPNYDQYSYIPGQHDMKKWLMAVKDIHYKKKAGLSYKEAIKTATKDWKKMEVYDFLNWLKFYEEGAHMKYKFAQVWYENGQPGYFLHVKPDQPKEDEQHANVDTVREDADRNEEKRSIIEKQRQKIIGRLDSAEKLLRSTDGQTFAGPELEGLMEAIYSLKKKVQLVNKLSISTRLYEDMIVREANILSRQGFVKAAEMLYSVAQTPGASAVGATGTGDAGAALSPAPPPDPSGAGQSGTMAGGPQPAPGAPNVNTPVGGDQNKDQPSVGALGNPPAPAGVDASTPPIMPQEAPQPEGIKGLIENMNDGNKTDETKSDDNLEVVDELEVSDQEEMLMVSEAQIVPPAPPGVPPVVNEDIPLTDEPPPERQRPAFVPTIAPKAPAAGATLPPVTDEPLEVTEDDIPATTDVDKPDTDVSEFDSKMDRLLANVTMADIAAELESLTKVFKVRELPRRLSKVDMMMQGKGISSFFPQLGEAQNKTIEAYNYCSTRVEDILSKVRGAMTDKEVNVKEPGRDADGVKSKLEQDAAQEKQRKQMRKEQEAAEMAVPKKETPAVEMGELAPPAPPAVPKPVG